MQNSIYPYTCLACYACMTFSAYLSGCIYFSCMCKRVIVSSQSKVLSGLLAIYSWWCALIRESELGVSTAVLQL